MRLVREIRDGVVDSRVELSTVLRKAKILAVALKNEEFKNWVSNELSGYYEETAVPSYREVASLALGDFAGPFGQRITAFILPISLMPDFLQKGARTIRLPNPIKELESMAHSSEGELRRPWPPEAAILLRDKIQLSGDFELVEAYQPIRKAHLESILDAVRNRLLDFLLGLQEMDPTILDSEDALRELPKEAVNQVFHVSIFGNHNVLASGSGFHQAVTQAVRPHDMDSLLSTLRQAGIDESDLNELNDALSKDGPQEKGQFGDRVKAWMGKVFVKAADGTWKTALATAPEVITKALSAYYGWE